MSDRERLREQREASVRRHMEAENVHDFDAVIDTFSHPRYELIPTGAIHDGEAAVREYFRETRTAFPDQRNELISLRHVDDGVVVEFWLLGTHRGPLGGLRADRARVQVPDDGVLPLRGREDRVRARLLRLRHDPAPAHGLTQKRDMTES